jgi:hypothetical protein
MNDLLERISFSSIVWLLPTALLIHEVEEWNILRWYRRNFVDLSPILQKLDRFGRFMARSLGFDKDQLTRAA